jgi:hypothetical protein
MGAGVPQIIVFQIGVAQVVEQLAAVRACVGEAFESSDGRRPIPVAVGFGTVHERSGALCCRGGGGKGQEQYEACGCQKNAFHRVSLRTA